ncbi:MAG TPA: nicotinate-nucleotide adenylyltransferase [Nevskiaceae bacterium]|nr:nicotinate-nucleotide adenylyltransferase [Nevskiaceae bacterium]
MSATGSWEPPASDGLLPALGLFGGTFAPIHHGHLRLAIELRERLRLEAVHLIPSARPPHRGAPQVSAERRLHWLRLAIAGEPGLQADDRELRREGPSYTIDTLASVRAEHPRRPLLLLLGDDAANQLHTWHRWSELLDLAHLVFVERPFEPPAPAPALQARLRGRRASDGAALLAVPAGRWISLGIPPLAISSSRVRGLIKAGRSLRGLVPEAVIHSFTAEDLAHLSHEEDPIQD